MILLMKRANVFVTWSLVAISVAIALSAQGAPWRGDHLWGQETVAHMQIIGLGLLAGAVAIDGASAKEGILRLLYRPAERGRYLVREIGAWWIPGVLVVVLAHVFVFLASRDSAIDLKNASIWPLLTQCTGLLVTVCFGFAVGMVLGTWSAAIVAGAVWTLCVIADGAGWLPVGLSEFSPSGSLFGYRPSVPLFAGRASWMLIVATLISLGVVFFTSWARVLWCAAIACFLLGMVPFGSNDGYQYSEEGASICVGSDPSVCGPSALLGRLTETQAIAAKTHEALRRIGVSSPKTFVSWSADADRSHQNWILVFNPGRVADPLSRDEVVSAVVGPVSCRVWWGSEVPSDDWFRAARLVRGYVLHDLYGAEDPAYSAFLKTTLAGDRAKTLTGSARALQQCTPEAVPDLAALGLQ